MTGENAKYHCTIKARKLIKYESSNASFKPYVALSRDQTKGPKNVKV